MSITAIIPAHNESAALPATIASLREQSIPPHRIIVVSDNSTDDTYETALREGVEAIVTCGNVHRKAGALNFVLNQLRLDPDELVLIMDADTQLSEHFIVTALPELAEPQVGGVGAIFEGGRPSSYLELCQFLEWSRYEEEIDRTGRTFVLSGTAALIKWKALVSVADATGQFYNTSTITEDMRLTLDLKEQGWELRSPTGCRATTEMMPTWRMLWLQRRRWYLGAMQNVTDLGFNRVTAPYWRQQMMLALSVTILWALLALTTVSLIVAGPTTPSVFWLAVGSIFAVERVVTIWDHSLRYKVFAALVIPELIYAIILQTAWVGAVYQKVTGSAGTWNHVKEEGNVR